MLRVPFAGQCRARVSTFADDITVFVSHRSDIEAVKKAVVRYELVAGAKVNFNKIKGLWLDAWRGGVSLLGPFGWNDRPISIPWVWFGADLQLE